MPERALVMSVPIPKFSSPEYPIRKAFGKLGYPASLLQTLELDLVDWVIEAMNLIKKDKKALRMFTDTYTVRDNQVPHCPEWQFIECVKKDGKPLTLRVTDGCSNFVTGGCRSKCKGGSQQFTVNECYTQFTPALPDGTEVEITSLVRPKSETGYPLVPEVCTAAVSEYVMWMLARRERDNRAGSIEARWYAMCRIARADLNKAQWQQPNIEKFGYIWWS